MDHERMDATKAHVAAAVRAELARQRIGIRELATHLGVTHTWLHRRVTGITDFTIGDLCMVADALGVPPEQFFPPAR